MCSSDLLTFVVFVPMLVGMLLVFYPMSGNGWLALPVVGQQIAVERALRGAPVEVIQGLMLALMTVVAAVPALAGAARVLRRDDRFAA